MSQSAANWASPRGLQPSYIIPRPKKLAIVLNVFGSFPLLWVFLNPLLSRCFPVLPILRKRAGSGTLLISLISFCYASSHNPYSLYVMSSFQPRQKASLERIQRGVFPTQRNLPFRYSGSILCVLIKLKEIKN